MKLVKRIVAGNESALKALYERYADPLFAFIYQHLNRSRPDAEDIWQDTFLAALRALPTYRGQSRLFTWLCGIARHKIADFMRRQGRSLTVPLSYVPEGKLSVLIASTVLSEEMVREQATRIRVIEALGVLQDDYRSALIARYIDDQSVDEIAQQLDRTYKATESLLSRARAAFQAALIRLEEYTG